MVDLTRFAREPESLRFSSANPISQIFPHDLSNQHRVLGIAGNQLTLNWDASKISEMA